jgi:hypothetical protein
MSQEPVRFVIRRQLEDLDELARATEMTPELHRMLTNLILKPAENLSRAARGETPEEPLPTTKEAFLRLALI